MANYLPAATELDDALANETHYGPRLRAIERALMTARVDGYREAMAAVDLATYGTEERPWSGAFVEVSFKGKTGSLARLLRERVHVIIHDLTTRGPR